MQIISETAIKRECFQLSPRFVNEEVGSLDLTIHFFWYIKNGEIWEPLSRSRPDSFFVLGMDKYINLATKLFCAADAPGAVHLLTFVATADGAAMGLTSVTGQSLFDAIGNYLEELVIANNLI